MSEGAAVSVKVLGQRLGPPAPVEYGTPLCLSLVHPAADDDAPAEAASGAAGTSTLTSAIAASIGSRVSL